ncbi:MAG: A24 family peptidase [Rhodocyclales bacterium]|nr:A24 family peptidase [Rhodocyclales bacterium]
MSNELLSTLPVAGIVLGLCIGSFLNVVIHRLPKMLEQEWQQMCAEINGQDIIESEPSLTLSHPRSRCPHCGHQITAIENIPLISYLFILKGKCSACKAAISVRYPLIEAVTALISGATAYYFGPSWQAVGALLLIWALIALSAIDFDTQLLPDSITLPLVWLGITFNLFNTFTSLESAVIGAMAGYLSLWSISFLFKKLTGRDGMGGGDFKLLAALGAWLGWKLLPSIVLLSSVVGAAVGIALIVFTKHGRDTPIPFGPYLAAAGGIALFWGEKLTNYYLTFAKIA